MTRDDTPSIRDLRRLWGDYRATPLIDLPELARSAGVARVFLKLENERPLNNFKALGGMYAGIRALDRASLAINKRRRPVGNGARSQSETSSPQLLCASAGNHGLAVAAAAKRYGTRARVYISQSVSPMRVARIEEHGGEVVRIAGTYDDAVRIAEEAARRGEGLLIPDTSSEADDAVVRDVLAGYGLLTREICSQLRERFQNPPTHVFVQAGVGGLAAAMAGGLSRIMKDSRHFIVVEPEAAACVGAALRAGEPVRIETKAATSADMLRCGMASAPALRVLLANGAQSIEVNEDELRSSVGQLQYAGGPETTESGAAGLAGLMRVAAERRREFALSATSRVLLVVTEARPASG